MDDDVARGVRRADVDQVHGDAVQVGPRLPSACGYLDSHGWRQDVPPATDGGAPMRLRATCSVLPVALAVLASLVAGTSRAPAADDVLPPTLTCVDGLLTKIAPRPGELSFRRRRWFCDVDGQANGVCTFGSLPPMLRLSWASHPMRRHGARAGWRARRTRHTGVPLQQHAHALRADVDLRHPDGGLRRSRAGRSRRLLFMRARACRMRGGSELSLRRCRPVPAAVQHMHR